MDKFLKKLHAFIHSSKHRKLFSFLTIIILVLAIPLTVFIAQKQQELRQQASTNQVAIAVTPLQVAAGGTVNIQWNASPTASDTVSTQSILKPVYNLYLSGSGPKGINGNYHFYTTNYDDAKKLTINDTWTWQKNPAWYAYSTQVDGTVPIYHRYLEAEPNSGYYGVHMYTQNKDEVPIPPWQDAGIAFYAYPSAQNGAVPVYHMYFPGANPGIHYYTTSYEEAYGTSEPNTGLVKNGWQDAGIAFYAHTSPNTQGFHIPSFIQKAYAQVTLTGTESFQLFRVENGTGTPQPAGQKIYLNCQSTPPQQAEVPQKAFYTGICTYPIHAETSPDTYLIRMFSADGSTILSDSNTFVVTTEVDLSQLQTIPDRFIVTFKKSTPQPQRSQAAASVDSLGILAASPEMLSPNSILVKSRPGRQNDVVTAYKAQGDVVEVIPDFALTPLLTPNDPLFPRQQGLQTIQVPEAWNYGQGQGIKIAIIDLGIFDHPDLRDNMGLQKNFFGNGLQAVDEHGTIVAGIAAATYNNNYDLAGVAGKASILNAKGGDTIMSAAAAIQGITWATDNGAKVINMSFGAQFPCVLGFQDAVDYAWSHGVVLIASAGNDGQENAIKMPANCKNVIAVGATNTAGTARMGFSNYGSNIPLAAPGENEITTTVTTLSGDYGGRSGTSISAPFVAGVVALMLEKYPGATPDFIRDRLFATAKPIAGFSHGLVNASAALSGPAPVIPTPTPKVISACDPRPPVKVQTAPTGDGRLRVTVSSTTNAAMANSLSTITWNKMDNAAVEGMNNASQGQVTTLSTGNASTSFIVKRITPGVAATVHFVVKDSCGDWPTFVGGGPSAF